MFTFTNLASHSTILWSVREIMQHWTDPACRCRIFCLGTLLSLPPSSGIMYPKKRSEFVSVLPRIRTDQTAGNIFQALPIGGRPNCVWRWVSHTTRDKVNAITDPNAESCLRMSVTFQYQDYVLVNVPVGGICETVLAWNINTWRRVRQRRCAFSVLGESLQACLRALRSSLWWKVTAYLNRSPPYVYSCWIILLKLPTINL